MKYVKQFTLILLISFAGEGLRAAIPLPIPASIYGIVLMLLGLCTGLIPLGAVKETSDFLVEIMPVMFIPAAVGLLDTWGILKPVWVPYLVIPLVTTVLVMAAAGRVTQWMLRRENKQKEGEAND